MTEARKIRICIAIIALLLLVLAAMVYKFIVLGSTGGTTDGRTVVLITPAERTFVLTEMRGLLAGVQGMSEALAGDDVARVARIARSLGMQADTGAPPGLMGKLPLEFKTLGLSVHTDFDRLADKADAKAAPKELLSQLSGVMQKCIACHDRYQFNAAPAQGASLGRHLAAHSGDLRLATKY